MVKFFEGASAISLDDRVQDAPATPRRTCSCSPTRINIGDASYTPRNCAWNGGRVWGDFDLKDAACVVPPPPSETHFEPPPHSNECQRNGTRHWSAIITGTHYTGDWVTACRQTPINIGGASYIARNCAWNGGRVWGDFDVKDPDCEPRLWFETPARGECSTEGHRTWKAVITGSNYYGDWLAACGTTTAPDPIAGDPRATRSCALAGLRAWGTFEMNDESCKHDSHPLASRNSCYVPQPNGATSNPLSGQQLAIFFASLHHRDDPDIAIPGRECPYAGGQV